MEVVRTVVDPEAGRILVGIGPGLVWLAVSASAALVVAHLVWARWGSVTGDAGIEGRGLDLEFRKGKTGIAPRVLRHTAMARAFHWGMSLATLILLVTGLSQVLGLPAGGGTLHWAAGLALVIVVAWHVIHAIVWQDVRSMWMNPEDVRAALVAARYAASLHGPPSLPAGKYPWSRKLHHNLVATSAAVAMATGSLMMVRIDTPLWVGNPAFLSPTTWGWLYLAHGLAAVGLIVLITAHVYFALRPERRWLTWSIVRGWITRERYLANHDPRRWLPRTVAVAPPVSRGVPSDPGTGTPPEEV